MDPLFLLSPAVSADSPSLSVEWVERDMERVFLRSQLLGNVTSVTPQGKIVRVGRGSVRPPAALLVALLLALVEQGSGVFVVQGGPGLGGKGPAVHSGINCRP